MPSGVALAEEPAAFLSAASCSTMPSTSDHTRLKNPVIVWCFQFPAVRFKPASWESTIFLTVSFQPEFSDWKEKSMSLIVSHPFVGSVTSA